VQGDVRVTFGSRSEAFGLRRDAMRFFLWMHTGFIQTNPLVFSRDEVDAVARPSGVFEESFALEFHFASVPDPAAAAAAGDGAAAEALGPFRKVIQPGPSVISASRRMRARPSNRSVLSDIRRSLSGLGQAVAAGTGDACGDGGSPHCSRASSRTDGYPRQPLAGLEPLPSHTASLAAAVWPDREVLPGRLSADSRGGSGCSRGGACIEGGLWEDLQLNGDCSFGGGRGGVATSAQLVRCEAEPLPKPPPSSPESARRALPEQC
jgi:hypothetical protein